MKRRTLLIALVTASLCSGGFAATAGTMTAAAQQQQIVTVKLLTGQVLTYTLPVGASTSVSSLKALNPAVVQVLSVTLTPPTVTPPPVTVPTVPSTKPPTGTTTTGPSTGQTTTGQTTTGTTTSGQTNTTGTTTTGRKGKSGHRPGPGDLIVGQATPGSSQSSPAQARVKRPPHRTPSGAPTPANPSFSLSLPGPAPIGVPNFFIEKFRIPPFLLSIYQAAGIEYGVPWQVLAAINEIETDYGRNLNVSTAGAVGWMQFLPSTWKRYGVDANNDGRKDPYNPVDAIFGAARYLRAAGADKDLRKAIFSYNHADWYVNSVLLRAKLIGGLPADLVGSLTGLTQGHFPVAAKATYADDLTDAQANKRIHNGNASLPVNSSPTRRGINIYSHRGAPVIAVNDGVVRRVGVSKRLGRYVVLQDVYGNTYTYGQLGKVSPTYPAPKPRTVSPRQVRRELELPKADPKPSSPASAGASGKPARRHVAAPVTPQPAPRAATVTKERLFAHPTRARSYKAGGSDQLLATGRPVAGYSSFESYFTKVLGLHSSDVVLRKLKPGAQVIAGTILGRIDKTNNLAPHLYFEIRPTGKGAPRIDPKPILDGWKLLESTAIYRAAGKNPFFGPDAKTPTVGQILLMSKEALERRVLADPRVDVYACGRRDVQSGQIDRRVLATLEYLSASGLRPTVSALKCGHSFLTTSGNVSEHSSGNAVDIAAINGIPIIGHQGAGSITEITIRRLLNLQGTLKPHQIISLMTFKGTDNTLSLPDHADHIHVGFRPLYGTNSKLARQFNAVLKPGQWLKLIDRLNQIDNPVVPVKPSKYSIPAGRGSLAHQGE